MNMTDQEFVLEANISNKLESAYEAKLFVVHPTALSYINLKTEKNRHVSIPLLKLASLCVLKNRSSPAKVLDLNSCYFCRRT